MSTIPPRPVHPTVDDLNAIAGKLVDELLKTCDFQADQRQDMIDDLVRCGDLHCDGYELAKRLDDAHGWMCNMHVAEILDKWQEHYREALRREQETWVRFWRIVPSLPIGAQVKTLHHGTGRITGVSERHPASYEIKLDSDPPQKSRRIILPFEAVISTSG